MATKVSKQINICACLLCYCKGTLICQYLDNIKSFNLTKCLVHIYNILNGTKSLTKKYIPVGAFYCE